MRGFVILLLAALLLSPVTAGQAGRDHVADLEEGAPVALWVSYELKAIGARDGATTFDTASGESALQVAWDAAFDFALIAPGQLQGFLITEWSGSAEFQSKETISGSAGYSTMTLDCVARNFGGPMTLKVVAAAEDVGLRVRFEEGTVTTAIWEEDKCRAQSEGVLDGESFSSDETRLFSRPVPLTHWIDTDAEGNLPSFETYVPYVGETRVPVSFKAALPAPRGSDAPTYCPFQEANYDWAPGECRVEGELRLRVILSPCVHIKKVYSTHHAALQAVPAAPVGGDESAVRSWSESATAVVRTIVADQRDWAMLCDGELTPDPWKAVLRLVTQLRDAMLELGKRDELSDAGVRELISAERSRQMLGGPEESGIMTQVPAIARAMGPSGTMTVSVHSPVSLHVWSESGGHVGWDAESNASESTITGASYAGAPGGSQVITLPAGFYKVTVDELAAGGYLLEVRANGTDLNATDVFRLDSRAGRTSSTHYAVTDGWDGPRLDLFPTRRTDTPATVAFVNEGRPSLVGGGPASPSGGAPPVGGDDAGRSEKDTPGFGLALVLGAAAAAARWTRKH